MFGASNTVYYILTNDDCVVRDSDKKNDEANCKRRFALIDQQGLNCLAEHIPGVSSFEVGNISEKDHIALSIARDEATDLGGQYLGNSPMALVYAVVVMGKSNLEVSGELSQIANKIIAEVDSERAEFRRLIPGIFSGLGKLFGGETNENRERRNR